jgi:hypothetical protein
MPAAGMVCPIIDFTDPITARRPSAGRPKTSATVFNSTASPVGVPVPCASSRPIASGAVGSSPAAAHAWRRAATCPERSGLNRLDVRPSLATPVPRITA